MKFPPHRNEKKQSHIIIEMIECLPGKNMSKTIIKKSNNDVDITKIKSNNNIIVEPSIFETYAMVVEGKLNMMINGISTMLTAGEGKMVPAFNSCSAKGKQHFKLMLTTIIKGGY